MLIASDSDGKTFFSVLNCLRFKRLLYGDSQILFFRVRKEQKARAI